VRSDLPVAVRRPPARLSRARPGMVVSPFHTHP
jgi:hypothetical protein